MKNDGSKFLTTDKEIIEDSLAGRMLQQLGLLFGDCSNIYFAFRDSILDGASEENLVDVYNIFLNMLSEKVERAREVK